MSQQPAIVSAGHICLDLIPQIESQRASISDLLPPGSLLNVGPVVTSTGGSVANTGGALHRLGAPVRMVGKVGDDPFGEVVLSVLRRADERLAEHMIVDAEVNTSYTVVISPPGLDRVFLHHPGANDTFAAEDVRDEHLDGAALFHFGYPPLMERMYANDGAELERLLARVRERGLVTSLDMSMPDPDSPSGRIDWKALLRRVLPHVDFFLPSFDEISFMLGVEAGDPPPLERLREIGGWLLDAGASVVVLKLGSHGLYLRTRPDPNRVERLRALGTSDLAAWTWRELYTPCFKADVVGTTGAGDCTIAGFLAEVARGAGPEAALAFATAVGGFNVEAPDATSGIPARERVIERIRAGWEKHPPMTTLEKIEKTGHNGVFRIKEPSP